MFADQTCLGQGFRAGKLLSMVYTNPQESDPSVPLVRLRPLLDSSGLGLVGWLSQTFHLSLELLKLRRLLAQSSGIVIFVEKLRVDFETDLRLLQ